jgi:branched-chain amino acid transport system substrate-binding protein
MYKIQLIAYDHKYTAPEAVTTVNRLIKSDNCRHVSVILGAMVYATAPIMDKAGVMNWAIAFAKETVSPKYPLQTNSCLLPPETTMAWKLIRKNWPDLKTVAGIFYNNESGKWSEECSKINAQASGFTFLETDLVDVGTVDFSPALLKVLKNKPDILEISGLGAGDAGSAIKTARGLGHKGPIAHLGTPDVVVTMKVAGVENCENYIVHGNVSEELPPELKGYATIRDKYLAKYGPPFNSIAWQYSHLPTGFIAALQKAGTVEPRKVAQAVEGLKFTSPLGGEASYGGKVYYGVDRQIQYTAPLGVIKGGKVQFLGLIPIEYGRK